MSADVPAEVYSPLVSPAVRQGLKLVFSVQGSYAQVGGIPQSYHVNLSAAMLRLEPQRRSDAYSEQSHSLERTVDPHNVQCCYIIIIYYIIIILL